jgi:hypothetical protein
VNPSGNWKSEAKLRSTSLQRSRQSNKVSTHHRNLSFKTSGRYMNINSMYLSEAEEDGQIHAPRALVNEICIDICSSTARSSS